MKIRQELKKELNREITEESKNNIRIALEQDWRTNAGREKAFNSLLNAQENSLLKNDYSDYFIKNN